MRDPKSDLIAHLQQHLGATYTIEREIGAGGMAMVFLARDIKHERQVAIKVLNPELGAVLGVERFLAEIRVTANLQHPNLLPLFDSGDAGGQLFYVMPFVAGETLRARLEREKQLPVDESVRIAVAVANALDYAHEHGVIHRDLKPENILLQHGQPVIADFGIALAISKAGGSRVTQTGLSLGTPQYMSPEQAAGDRTIDGRSDIYSLGAILYEMLAGEPPHVGNTVQAIIAKVLTDKPRSLRLGRDTVPVRVEMAVEKALAKLPADRFATAGQFVRALEGDVTGLMPNGAARNDASRPARAWIRHPASIATMVLAMAGAAVGAWALTRPAPAVRAVRFQLATPPGSSVHDGLGHLVAISPDGRRLTYVGEGASGSQLWLRDLDQSVPRPLAGTEDPYMPAFSPDGRTIVYWNNTRRQCMKIPADGGTPVPTLDCNGPATISWYAGDSVIFSRGDAASHLYRTSINGGTPARLLLDDSSKVSYSQSGAYLAPDGATLFFTSSANATAGSSVIAYSTLKSRSIERTAIAAGAVLGYHAGRLIYATDDGAIMAVGFDLSSHRAVGQPAATNENTRFDAFGAKAFLSASGDLAYLSGSGANRPVLVQRGGGTSPVMKEGREYSYARFSPDGSRIALTIDAAGRSDIWIYVIASASLERLTTEGTDNQRPEWSPDGRRVLFRSNRAGSNAIWWQMIDGSAKAERLTPELPVPVQEAVLSPDGKTLLYRVDTPRQARDIFAMPMEGDRKPKEFLATEFDELAARFSPDGRWVAYVSSESGRDEVYVRPFPGPGGRVLVSSGGGGEPLWSRDGKRIFYRSLDNVLSAAITLGATPVVMARDTVVSGPYLSKRFHANYDVSPDGSKLLMLEPTLKGVQPTIVLNWAQALTARLGPVR